MYGITTIQRELHFWTSKMDDFINSKRPRNEALNNVVLDTLNKELSNIEEHIRSDIADCYEEKRNMAKFWQKFKNHKLNVAIAELEECLKEVKRRQQELKGFEF